MLESKEMISFKSYQDQANMFLKDYILADSLIPYTSVIGGILACKLIYDLTQLIGTNYFKTYNSFSKIQRIEWNNRAISTVHSIFITAMSLYLVFCSDLFSDNQSTDPITVRSSSLSTFALGVSVGYFIADIAMIFWYFPSLGGYEYVVHHLLSLVAVAYSMLSGEGQLYTYMVLISETTTPGINLRWYLDVAGMKRSKAYLINGVVIFLAWMVARILLFVYMFYHVYLHFDQDIQEHQKVKFWGGFQMVISRSTIRKKEFPKTVVNLDSSAEWPTFLNLGYRDSMLRDDLYLKFLLVINAINT